MARVRLADVAEAAGVSISTVSRVLTGAPGISEDVSRQVRQHAARLGYGANGRKTSASLDRIIYFSRLVDFGALAGRFPAEVLAGARDEAQASGLDFTCLPAATGAVSAGLTTTLGDLSRTGMVFQSIDDLAFIASFAAQGVPVVALNTETPLTDFDLILPDNAGGGAVAALEFLRAGHRKATILRSSDRLTIRRRADSFASTFRAGGGVVVGEELAATPLSSSPGEVVDILRGLMSAPEPPTALFCTVDLLAVACLGAFAELGVRTPDDVSIIGFDDLPVAELTTPALTTVSIDRRALGVMAVRRLLERAREPSTPVLRTEMAARLVRRDSVVGLAGPQAGRAVA
jgi:DNA-binding LacI/PurR family transcriptional regulator